MNLTRRQFAAALTSALAMASAPAGVRMRAVRAAAGGSGALASSTDWFREARFGMFVHFGLYSLLARGEWVMHRERIPIPEYEKLLRRFDPRRFSAREWVALAKAAGQRYLTITAKHHDGFCLFDSDLTRHKITRTPFGRDLIRELTDECHRQGMPIFLYYSLMDWHHPAYRGSLAPRTAVESGFVDYLKGQLRELCTKYGRIAGIWFDGDWDHSPEQWQTAELLGLIRSLQPEALVNNRAGLPGDFSTPEQQIGARVKYEDDALREACMTINDNWGYSRPDQRYKSSAELIQMLALAAGNDTNLLLNVGPMANGEIQPEFVVRLRQIGRWLERNGESIYATRGTNQAYLSDMATTRRGRRTYFHVFNWRRGTSVRMDLPYAGRLKRSYVLETGRELRLPRNPSSGEESGSVNLNVVNTGWGPENVVVVLETEPSAG